MKRFPLVLCLLALATFGLGACGDDEDEPSAGGETTEEAASGGEEAAGGEEASGGEEAAGGEGDGVAVTADPDGGLVFVEEELTAPAGSVTFTLDNPAPLTHDFCIESGEEDLGCTDQIAQDSSDLTVELEAGEYVYYCSVPGHREQGMEGTLTVE